MIVDGSPAGDSMSADYDNERFVQQLTACQGLIYAYTRTLLPNVENARDVLQETNVVLWRKRDEFEPGTGFGAWACKVAYYQVLAFLRDAGRERVVFSPDLVDVLAREAKPRDVDARRSALSACLEDINESQRQLLNRRYSGEESVQALAKRAGKTPAALSMQLVRIRQSLANCIKRRLNKDSLT